MGSSCVRIHRLADLKGGSGGQTYRQGMQPSFTSSESRSISGKTSDRSPGELFFRHDQDGHTGPLIMP
jgi:hypothetical protein